MSVEKSDESILKKNNDLFELIGELEGYHHIELDKSINSVIHPPRRVPIALHKRFKSEIENRKIRHCGKMLRDFNSTKTVKLSVDALQNGLGAVLLQKELPIECASRALTTSQKNWAQIEKDLYAIVFGCERYHQYAYGMTIEAETDHKPLEAIFK
ncbi:unnamed protein product [Mytilus coruscus]|uniref:Reverse transcriptase RNase H-like domain-containing protein n=1 Tax=Mytilus coruscus TaxID=42192 RepID=A0A6J8BJK5_MYTCO|nr:unnamed protein product [Mytilus coruscus]